MNEPSPENKDAGKMSILAVVSVIFSCAHFILPGLSLGGIICGHLALTQIRKNPELKGEKIALVGLALGYILFFVSLVQRSGILHFFQGWH
jgi:hypothetical protein